MTTSRHAWDKPLPEESPRFYEFTLNHTLLVVIALTLLLITACHHNIANSAAIFGKVVTAADVDANNAPTAISDTFSPSQKTVYVVAEAKEVAPGARLKASWTRDGTPVQVSDEVVASQGYHDTNIEFHLNPGTGGFTPGNYKVQLIVNDQPGPSADFTVK